MLITHAVHLTDKLSSSGRNLILRDLLQMLLMERAPFIAQDAYQFCQWLSPVLLDSRSALERTLRGSYM